MRILFYDAGGTWNGGMRVLARAAHGLATRGHQVTFVCRAGSRIEGRLPQDSFEIVPHRPAPALLAAWRLGRELSSRLAEVLVVRSRRDHLVAALSARIAERAAILCWTGHGATLPVSNPVALRLAASGCMYALDEDARRARPPRATRLDSSVIQIGVSLSHYDEIRPATSVVLGGREGGTRRVVCIYDEGARVALAGVLRTLSLLATRHPDVHLVVVGAGSQNEELRLHAAALRVSRAVTLLGEREDELEVMRAAELGWVVAAGDTGAWAMLDFAGLGVPVLAERSAVSARYVADGITGLLLSPGQPPEGAAMISRLLASSEERTAMGSAARARAGREFCEDGMAAAFERAVLAAGDRTRW